jgi:spermidine synthase
MGELPSDTDWHLEYITPELVQAVELRRVIYSGRTQYQEVALLDTGPFGRSLVLDGRTQSSEADEFVYHEGLVQPVMAAHHAPKRVFIAGGGEGATAREVLRHTNVAQVVMVDLDQEVVELCRRHLPGHHQGAFDDPRLVLHHEDALAFLERTYEPFDVVIIDVPDPLEAGPAYKLFTQEFYRLVGSRLSPGGLMVAQAGPAGPINYTEIFTAIAKTAGSVFPRCSAYRVHMPSFGTSWGFVACGGEETPSMEALSPEEIDARMADRLSAPLRYYDGIAHNGMFALPKYLRQGFIDEQRLITMESPIYAT